MVIRVRGIGVKPQKVSYSSRIQSAIIISLLWDSVQGREAGRWMKDGEDLETLAKLEETSILTVQGRWAKGQMTNVSVRRQ